MIKLTRLDIPNGLRTRIHQRTTRLRELSQAMLLIGFLIARHLGQHRARITIDHFKLNRPELLGLRRERIELLQALADHYMLDPPGPVKDLLRSEMCRSSRRRGGVRDDS